MPEQDWIAKVAALKETITVLHHWASQEYFFFKTI